MGGRSNYKGGSAPFFLLAIDKNPGLVGLSTLNNLGYMSVDFPWGYGFTGNCRSLDSTFYLAWVLEDFLPTRSPLQAWRARRRIQKRIPAAMKFSPVTRATRTRAAPKAMERGTLGTSAAIT